MANILISLLTIALMAMSLWIGVNKINYDIYDKRITETKIKTDFQTYESAIKTHRCSTNIYPNNETWELDLLNVHLLIPDNKGEYRYSKTHIPSDPENPWVGVCLSKTVSKKVFQYIKSTNLKGTTVLANDCFKLNTEAIDESGEEVTFYLTHWINVEWKYVNTGVISPITPLVPDPSYSGKDK